MAGRPFLWNGLQWSVGNGRMVKFWTDKWLKDGTLAEKYQSFKTMPAYVINRDITNYSSILVINVPISIPIIGIKK